MVEYILIGLVTVLFVFNIIILIILLKIKNNKNDEESKRIKEYVVNLSDNMQKGNERIIEKNSELRVALATSINDFTEKTNKFLSEMRLSSTNDLHKGIKEITADFIRFEEKIFNQIDTKMNQINEKVEERLTNGFTQTNETFKQIVERISRIDAAQKNIEKLSGEVVSLQDILSDKKSRGTFGEVNLKQLFSAVYGESNDKIYRMQHKLSNGCIADSVLFTPEPLGMLCIDSKFPLENYQRMLDRNYPESERNQFQKAFKADVRKHIDAIKEKYIIKNETATQACMFLPSEAIFAEINAYHPDLVEYSYKANVWITSPTTLMAFLTTIQLTLQNIEKNKYTNVIHDELEKLSVDFNRYHVRWDKLKKDIDTISKDVLDIHTTTEKISNRFDKINQVDIVNPSELVDTKQIDNN